MQKAKVSIATDVTSFHGDRSKASDVPETIKNDIDSEFYESILGRY
jgi:hypothetical protein